MNRSSSILREKKKIGLVKEEFEHLKRPQVIETRAIPRIGYALITAKTEVKIYFVQ